MAPKSQISHRRSFQTARETTQSSKQRREAPRASRPPEQSPTSSISCASKTVTIERCVSFQFLHKEGFSISESLTAIGLEKLFSQNS